MPQSLYAQNCLNPPSQLQLHFSFDWPLSERDGLVDILELQCGEAENIIWLGHRIKGFFESKGIVVSDIKTRKRRAPDMVEYELITQKDGASKQVILFDLEPLQQSRILIPVLNLSGEGTDSTDLTASFVVNQELLSFFGGIVDIKWYRNGSLIEAAKKSRYRLEMQDVGTSIAATIFISVQGRVVAYREAVFNRSVKLAEKPPEAHNVALSGKPVIGQKLTVDYQFSDLNPEDSEAGTQIIWLRDNQQIKHQNDRVYHLVAADIGRVISAQVTPVSSDGLVGQPVMASLSQKVDDGLIKLTPEILDKAMERQNPVASEPTEFRPITTPKTTSVLARNQAWDDKNAPRMAIRPDVYLTKGFRIQQGSPSQITGLKLPKSALLSVKTISDIEQRFIGQDIDVESLKQIIEAINEAYKEAGFALSRALLPEQVVDDGRIEIKIVEVQIGKIIVENNKAVSEDFILNQLGYKKGDFISLEEFEIRLRHYNATNKSKLKTELAPGTDFGTTDIFVRVEEPDRLELPSISINNYNKDLSDIVPQSFSTTVNNLVGVDDELSLSVSDGAGTSAYSAGLSVPLGWRGVNLSVNVAGAETKSTTENAELVGYRGTSSSIGSGVSFPLFMSLKWSAFGSASYGRSSNDMVAPVTGDLLAKSKTEKLLLSLPVSYSDGVTAVSLSPSWHVIHNQTEIPPTNKWIQKLDMDMSASRYINPALTANFAGRFLYTNARAFLNMPDEILSVGGPGSVRAYRPSESSGYRGWFLTGELRTDLANWQDMSLPQWVPNIQPYVFVDHVNAREVYGQSRRADRWSGYGIGLSVPSIFNYFSFDTYWAEPLDDDVHQQEKEAYKDDLLQFSLSAKLQLN